MREAVCFVLIYVFVNTVETVKPKSVNLALETVLQFDKKDHSADVEVLDRVQSFLDNIKDVMARSKQVQRRSNDDDLKFTDFLLEATEILKTYDDNDLEDFFVVLDDQSRKYNYKGCKFYELVDNNDVRRFMSNKLEQAKDTSATTMRRYLSDVAKAISSDRFDDKHRTIIDLVNSLYDGASGKFGKITKSLRSYSERAKDSALNLDDIVSNALRTLVFDHYSNLNDNARQQLKTALGIFWTSNHHNFANVKDHAHNNNDIAVQDYKSKLRVIDVPSMFSKKNGDRLKVKNLKGTSSYKKDKRHKKKRITPKIDIDFMNFKKTTREQPVTVSDEESIKRNEKPYGVTQGLTGGDLSNSYELKKPKNIENSYKAVIPTKTSSDDEGDTGADSEKSSSGDSKDKKGISIEFANEKYISKQNKKHKKQKIEHITYDVERRHKFKAHDYSDEDDSDKDSVTNESADSSEEVSHSKRPEHEDLDESGVLIGGQNIHDMGYRVEHQTHETTKRNVKQIVEELGIAKSNMKLRDRLKPIHKSLKKSKDKKNTTAPSDVEEESTTKTIDTKDSKDSAFASSDEGITIESFEDAKENKYSNLRKALKPTTGSVRRLIHNLEKQLEDVKERMKLVTVGNGNRTEGDAQTGDKDIKSDSKVNYTLVEALTDAKAKVSDENGKAYEVQVSGDSRALSNTDTETTKTKTTTTIEYETDGKTKPNRTTMQETSKSTKSKIFRSEVDDIDIGKSLESKEKDNVITDVGKNSKTSKADVLKETTTINTKTDSIFKTSAEKIASTLKSDGMKIDKESNASTKLPEGGKTETTLDRKEEKENVEKITTVIDLTKHLNNSDTVVVNMKDKIEDLKEKQESTRNLSDEMGLPNPPNYKDGKLDDPFNDLDVNLDFI